MKRLTILIASVFCFIGMGYAQENCSDGIDNDGDGFVDCYDNECASDTACEDFFLNDEATCEVAPTEFPEFKIREMYKSAFETASNHSVIVVGDIRGDNTPEVIVANSMLNGGNDKLSILSGIDLTTIDDVTVGNMAWQEYIAIAKIDDPDCGYIFLSTGDDIIAYDCNLNKVWATGEGGIGTTHGNTGQLNIADFNHDGTPELYYKNEIRDALTGELLVSGVGNWLGKSAHRVASGSIAVDIDPGVPGLELVNGLTIYEVNTTGPNWSLSQINREDDYYPYASFGGNENHSFTSIADWDNNGELDVVANGAINDAEGYPTVFLWLNPMSGSPELKTFSFTNAGMHLKSDAPNGTGIVNIANIDDTPGLNCTFAIKEYVYALDENFEFKWRIPITEASSGNTGTTVFDFNGDGENEIVYRDENHLYIIQDDGATGQIKEQFICGSQTGREYPIVVDVNGDGETEILSSCAANDGFTIGNTPPNQEEGVVKMFASLDEKWIRARSVWNQHGYFNVNVNDDVTIPVEQQKHHVVFSNTLCETDEFGNPVTGEVRPLNTFLNQSPYLDINGCPSYGAPDLTYDDASVTIYPPTCPDSDFYVSFNISNEGDLPFNSKLYVSFYDGDPSLPETEKLNTDSITVTNLAVGASLQIDSMLVKGPGPVFDLYVRMNDPATVSECNPDNNTFSRTINPLPFNIEALKRSDNNKCVDSLPDNGSAEAYVWDGVNQTTAGYTFAWYQENGMVYDSVFAGAVYSGMAEGNYKVTATHSVKGCGSDTVDVVIDRTNTNVEWVTIEQLAPFTSCTTPNGELKVNIWKEDGSDTISVTSDPSVNYEFRWYKGTEFTIGNIIDLDSIASGLEDIEYSVEVINPLTGCVIPPISYTVQSLAEYPDILDIDIIDIDECGMLGELDVVVVETTSGNNLNEANDLTYRWYSDSDTTGTRIPGESGKVLDDQGAGNYGVVAVLNSNGCESNLATPSIADNTVYPTITVNAVEPNSSCDPANPNGSIEIADESPHEIRWYKYDYVDDDWDFIAGSEDNYTINDLDSGWYRAVVRHVPNKCETEEEVYVDYIPQTLSTTLINITPSDQTNCDDVNPNGSITATYDGQTAGYLFYWSMGNAAQTPPDFTGNSGNGYVYNGIPDSVYTLIVADATTLCETLAVVDTVGYAPDRPAINLSITDQTSCDTSSPNGAVLATASSALGEPGAGYLFELIDGGVVENSVDNQPGATGLNTTGLDAGTGSKTYTVRATNRSNLCVSTTPATVTDDQVLPVVTVGDIVVTSNSNCAAPGNGVLDATTAASTSGGEPASGYTYHWYAPDGTQLSETGPVLSGLMAGFYEVEVENNDSKCISGVRVSVEVDEDFVFPTVNPAVDAEQTACAGTPNGELSASAATAGGEPSGYDFRWYFGGSKVDSTLNAATSATGSLTDGTYTIVATNLDTRCEGSEDIYLAENLTYPEINPVALTDNGFCATPGNGLIDAAGQAFMPGAAPEPTGGYTYEWYTAADAFIHSDSAILGSLSEGTYKLIAVNNDTECPSQPGSYEIEDDPDPVTVVINSITDQTSCSPDETDHTGALSAEVDEGGSTTTSGYTFVWRRGQTTSTPILATTPDIDSLTDVTYTIWATSDSTGCTGEESYKVVESLTYPVLNTATSPVTTCNPFDGEVSADIGGVTAGYSFFWSDSAGVKDPADHFNPVYSGLEPGDFTAYAIDDYTKCYSDTVTVTVADNSPEIEVTLEDLQAPAFCDESSGIIEVSASSTSSGNFDFEWFKYPGPAPVETDLNTTLSEINNQFYGNFEVIVTSLVTACSIDTTFFLPYVDAHEGVVKSTIDADMCKAPYNGRIDYGINTSPTNPDPDDYAYHLYEGLYNIGDAKTPILTDEDNGITNTIDSLYLDLAPGVYTFSIVEKISPHACESQPVVVTINQSAEDPEIAFAATDNFSCDLGNPMGELAATATTPAGEPGSGYTFDWYEVDTSGVNIGPGILAGNVTTIEDLAAMTYALHVENNDTGCDTVVSKAIVDDFRDLLIDDIAITDQTNCGPDENGAIEILAISEDGIAGNIGDYQIDLFEFADLVNPFRADEPNPMIDLAAGEYMVRAINDSTLCEAEIDAEILLKTRNPLIVRTAISHDEYCDTTPGVGNGLLGVAVNESPFGGSSTETNDYDYQWFRGAGTTDPLAGEIIEDIDDLPSGQYTVRIADNNGVYLNCEATRTFTLNENNPEILVSRVTTSPQTNCLPNENGVLTVDEATYNGTPTAIPNGSYTIELLETPVVVGTTFNSLESGTYYVQATHSPTQCISPQKEVMIDIDLPVHTIEFAQVADWSCNANGQGELSAAAIRENGVATPLGDYTLDWRDNANNPLGAGITVTGLTDGQYQLTITDNTGPDGVGCAKTQNVTLLNDPRLIEITDINITDQSLCLPNGELFVVEVEEDGAVTGDTYTYTLMEDDLDTLANPGDGTAGSPYADLAADSYYVSAVNDVTGCESGFRNAIINDDSQDPVANLIELAKQTTKTPPATPNGSIRGWALEQDGSLDSDGDGTDDTYDFTWRYNGSALSTTNNITEETLVQRPAGMYYLEIRNRVSNCYGSTQGIIEEDVATPEITFTTANMTICEPADGAITITDVSIAGVAENMADYEFHLYRNFNTPSNYIGTIAGASENEFSFTASGIEIDAGRYYVVAEEINLGLVSNAVRVEILDNTTLPLVSLRDMIPQRSFNPDPAFHNGELSIIVNGAVSNNGNYSVRWFEGEDVSGTYLSAYDDSYSATGLTNSYYTIAITDIATGCLTTVKYYVNENKVPVLLSSSSKPNNYCVGANGQMATTVVNPNSNFDYYWYTQGGYPDDPADFTGQMLTGIPSGTYFVYVVDRDDPFRYGVDTVEVRDNFYYPDIMIDEISPQVNCDPAKPTGELLASINNNISMYQIGWFEETAPQDILGQNWIISNLPALSYVAEVRNVITGCENASDSHEVAEELEVVPAPLTSVSHLTHCVDPNGAIEASVDGRQVNYDFSWYFGSSVNNNPDYNGVLLYDLEAGPYTVTATSDESGCTSVPVTAAVEDRRIYPEFDISVVNTTCEESNGSASLYIKNHASVRSIVWTDDISLYYDYRIDEAPAGWYSVEVTTTEECVATQEFRIKPDINVFNGVSANGDGMNDKFAVGCIQDFENNKVVIFNRSGDKVFEMDNYDNDVNSFEGLGNKGLYIGRPELPVGTYFYIIDLKDGTEPKTGYLELVR